ncbi:MAG TPA: SpoIIE family protein phosphatase, partial [Desulfitobacteriaceae bacterium]|nr:SpoIIE family protein phosphatase [Desulfitobacteriaceae bacterium]
MSSPLQKDYGGDAYLVKKLPGKFLIAVIDGLGHGRMAYEAASRTLELLASNDDSELHSLMESMHEGLIGTVGVVLGLALIDYESQQITFAGIGNITIKLIGQKKTEVFLPAGILGYHTNFSYNKTITISPEDILLMHTDGISDNYRLNSFSPLILSSPKEIVQTLMSGYRRTSDDALVLAASELW